MAFTIDDRIVTAVEKYRGLMFEAERAIWKHPETGYKEWDTHAYFAERMTKMGYRLTEAGNIPGFYADIDTGRPGPSVLVMGELDSVICKAHPECDPETGAVHACGHHCQTSSLLGVAAALTEPGLLSGLSGRIRLMFVPAEELIELEYRESLRRKGIIEYYGGKVEFMRRGFMDGMDMAFYTHTGGGAPSTIGISGGGNGCITKNITFTGKVSHAAFPSGGINALYAANNAMNAINALRETFLEKDYIRVHPIITGRVGGVNNIPDCVTMESYVRGASLDAIRAANAKVNRALAAGAAAIGANVHLSDRPGYMPVHPDPLLKKAAADACRSFLDEAHFSVGEGWDTGCTDMGDISSVMPAICTGCAGLRGTGHGADLFVVDQESALVTPAKFHVALLTGLLRNGAEKAEEIRANAHTDFPSVKAYFETLEQLRLDTDAVEYLEDGDVRLHLHS